MWSLPISIIVVTLIGEGSAKKWRQIPTTK
jgi:hypothetical protein